MKLPARVSLRTALIQLACCVVNAVGTTDSGATGRSMEVGVGVNLLQERRRLASHLKKPTLVAKNAAELMSLQDAKRHGAEVARSRHESQVFRPPPQSKPRFLPILTTGCTSSSWFWVSTCRGHQF
jgi:hypothetical protein